MYERLSSESESFVNYRIKDRITSEEFDAITRSLESEIENRGKLKMLVEIDNMKFPGPGVVWDDLKFAFRHSKDFERFAVLGDKKWEQWWMQVADKMVSTECRYFNASEKENALEWVSH